jgi:hypothetical protein
VAEPNAKVSAFMRVLCTPQICAPVASWVTARMARPNQVRLSSRCITSVSAAMPSRISSCVVETTISPNSSASSRSGMLRWVAPATLAVRSDRIISVPTVTSTVPTVPSKWLRLASGLSSRW